MKRSTVLLADDHAIVVEGLRRVLEAEFDIVGSVRDGLALVEASEALRPDVVVADISMPLLNGIEAARRIRAGNRQIRIVFLSMHPDSVYVSEALRAGGSAYVLKSSAGMEIVQAIRIALEGRTFVTPAIETSALSTGSQVASTTGVLPNLSSRQTQIVKMVAEGLSAKEIAALLQISPRTVEFHRYRAMDMLGLHSVAELVQYAMRHRILPQ